MRLARQRTFFQIICICSLVIVTGFAGAPGKRDRAYYESRGEVVWEVPMDEKLIALTFDDGPNPQTTPEILNLLKQYDAKSTFFVIGRKVEQFPDVVKREMQEGHEVANHTSNHVYFSKRVNPAVISEEILKADRQIEAVTGQKHSPWFRPPGGYYNDTVIREAQKYGYTIVLWSWHQDTKDWRSPGVAKIVDKVLNNARNGDVVLFHDHVQGQNHTVEALRQILPELRERGFRMVTVSELVKHKRADSVNHGK